jgi:low affinity Fe/Cu permease
MFLAEAWIVEDASPLRFARDTTAINAKLDAIIIALEKADNRLVGLEMKPESDAKALCDEILLSVAELRVS